MKRQVPFFSNKNLRPVFLVTLFDQISTTIGYPILTFLCFDKQSSLFASTTTHAVRSYWYGIFNSLPFIVAIFSVPLLSLLSDYCGRKKILLLGAFGIFLFSIFTALSILYGTILLLLIGCIINGLCSRTEAVALAVVGDCSEPQEKAANMGYLQLFISTGAFFGPLLGGYFAKRFFFHTLNFSTPYLIGAGFGLCATTLVIFYFKETYKPANKNKIQFTQIFQLFANRKILKISLFLVLTQISWRIYYQFISPILKVNFHYSAMSVGLFVGLIALWLAFAAAFGIKFLEKFLSKQKILFFGCGIMFVGLLITIIACVLSLGSLGQTLIWLAAIPIAAGDVIAYSMITALYSNAVSPDDQGKIMGVNFIIVAMVWSFTGLLGGALAAISVNVPIIVAPISLILLLLITVLL